MEASKFYQYTAAEMLLGRGSPELKKLTIYKQDLIKKKYSGLTVEVKIVRDKYDEQPRKIREVSFKDNTYLHTSHINDSNDIARIITYTNAQENVCLSDVLFTKEEFKYHKMAFKKTLETRIDMTAILLKALNESDISQVPLVMNDFPNIVETLFIRSRILMK
jgi:hypothetical protein